MYRSRSNSLFLLLVILSPICWISGGSAQHNPDPLDTDIPRLALNEETVLNAVARLSGQTETAYCIEWLPVVNRQPDPEYKAVSEHRSLRDTLDWLMTLDRRYTWSRDGNTVNIMPAALKLEPNYVLNRRLTSVDLTQVGTAGAAVSAIMRQVSGPHEDVIFVQPGGSDELSKPWTETLHDVTVREAFNRVAEHLGPTVGWQLMHSHGYAIITFHQRLEPFAKKAANTPSAR